MDAQQWSDFCAQRDFWFEQANRAFEESVQAFKEKDYKAYFASQRRWEIARGRFEKETRDVLK
jgi:hypothetical protein